VDHWIDSPESRCVAGRAHWAEIACGHATTTKGRSCSFPTIARLSGPPFSAATGRLARYIARHGRPGHSRELVGKRDGRVWTQYALI
jgi:hypothetical protein